MATRQITLTLPATQAIAHLKQHIQGYELYWNDMRSVLSKKPETGINIGTQYILVVQYAGHLQRTIEIVCTYTFNATHVRVTDVMAIENGIRYQLSFV